MWRKRHISGGDLLTVRSVHLLRGYGKNSIVMSTMYMVILGILLLLAVYDLVVGITNDAANFLNSARGCLGFWRR